MVWKAVSQCPFRKEPCGCASCIAWTAVSGRAMLSAQLGPTTCLQNLLLNRDQVVKLTDFGISRILDHIFTRTQARRAHESVVACMVGFL